MILCVAFYDTVCAITFTELASQILAMAARLIIYLEIFPVNTVTKRFYRPHGFVDVTVKKSGLLCYGDLDIFLRTMKF